MSLLDILIFLLILTGSYFGFSSGAARQLGTGIGAILGLLLGSRLALLVPSALQPALLRASAQVCAAGLCTLIGTGIGHKLGSRVRIRLLATKACLPDKYLGIAVGAFGGLLLSWFGASLLLNVPLAGTQNTVLQSQIVAFIDRQALFNTSLHLIFLPHAQYVNQAGATPTIQGVSQTAHNVSVQGPFAQAAQADYRSVVLVRMQGCSVGSEGSGFVVAPQVVVTAAHVIGGANSVTVEDASYIYTGTVILYDTRHDVAALYVPGLPDKPLSLQTATINPNTPVATMGYPLGGPLTFTSGFGAYYSIGPIKVDNAGTIHTLAGEYYGLTTPVREGNSGGPIILQNGAVIGHVTIGAGGDSGSTSLFGASPSFSSADGPALLSYIQELRTSEKRLQRVSTGNCSIGL